MAQLRKRLGFKARRQPNPDHMFSPDPSKSASVTVPVEFNFPTSARLGPATLAASRRDAAAPNTGACSACLDPFSASLRRSTAAAPRPAMLTARSSLRERSQLFGSSGRWNSSLLPLHAAAAAGAGAGNGSSSRGGGARASALSQSANLTGSALLAASHRNPANKAAKAAKAAAEMHEKRNALGAQSLRYADSSLISVRSSVFF